VEAKEGRAEDMDTIAVRSPLRRPDMETSTTYVQRIQLRNKPTVE